MPWTTSTKTSYVVPVYVSDSKDAAGGTDTVIDDAILVTITVTNVNEAPVLAAGGESITRPENTSTSTVLHTFMASDEDAGTTFQWSYSGVDAAPFRITSNYDVTELTFRNTLDYEMPTDEGNMDNIYEIEVRVSDGSESDSINVTVTITDVNEAPVITTTGTSHTAISVPEGTATSEVLATYTADDPEMGMLTWTLSGTDAGEFTFVGGVLKFKSVPDFESGADNVYEVTVNVSDGSLSDTQPVTITVTDVNEPPVIASGPTTKNVAENTTSVDSYTASDVDMSDTISWTVESGDSSHFRIINNGELEFQNAPDFENKQDDGTDNIYNVTVRATDIGGLFDTRAVAVTVTNVDEDGTASFTGTLSGGSTLTASVTDPDGSITNKMYRWLRSGLSDQRILRTLATNGTSVTYVLVAADVTKYLRVRSELHGRAWVGQVGNQRFEGAHRRQQLRADVQRWLDGHAYPAGERGEDPRSGDGRRKRHRGQRQRQRRHARLRNQERERRCVL